MAAQGLEPAAVFIDIDEQLQVQLELVVAGIMIPPDRGVLDGAVHPLDSTVHPQAAGLGQAMLDLGLLARRIERVRAIDARLVALCPVGFRLGLSLFVRRMIVGEPDAIMR